VWVVQDKNEKPRLSFELGIFWYYLLILFSKMSTNTNTSETLRKWIWYILGLVITAAIWFLFTQLSWQNSEWPSQDKNTQREILKVAPTIEITNPLWSYEDSVLVFSVINKWDAPIYTEGISNTILTSFEVKDENWNYYPFEKPRSIQVNNTGTITIHLAGIKGSQLTISTYCKDNSWVSPNTEDSFDCKVKGDHTDYTYDLPNYKWLNVK
jgi:hypothetical protein